MFTLAVTAFNETGRGDCQWILECLRPAIQHKAVDEIVVVDDGSDDVDELAERLKGLPKVHVYANADNLGVFANKLESVYRATGDWVQLCDSDNRMDKAYLDRLVSLEPWHDAVWYCPSFARPEFDYRHLIGEYEVADMPWFLGQPRGDCCLNTGNQFLNRDEFLEVFYQFRGHRFDLMQPDYLGLGNRPDRRAIYDAVDSFFLNKTWLLSGHRLRIAEGLQYEHRYDAELSNWGRSPEEKTRMPQFYIRELLLGGPKIHT